MKTKLLIDTNLFIYAYDIKSAYYSKAIAFLGNHSFQFYSSTKNISEFFAVLSKQGESFQSAWHFYQGIRSNTITLFPDQNSLTIFETLMGKYQPKGNRVFDLEIASIAIANQIPEIATVNTKDFADISEIKIRTI